MSTIASIFAARVTADPASPLLTWYDSLTGERTELSGATLANWVSKTANLLVDEVGLGTGDVAVVELPPHWQTAAIMLGAWTAGLAVTPSGAGDVRFGLPDSAADYAVGLHPFAMPVRDLPAGRQDWVLSARVHGDHFGGPAVGPQAPAWAGFSHGELAMQATRRAQELGLSRGDRVLVDLDQHSSPLDWLLAPLTTAGSLVLCRHADASAFDKWAGIERVTARVA